MPRWTVTYNFNHKILRQLNRNTQLTTSSQMIQISVIGQLSKLRYKWEKVSENEHIIKLSTADAQRALELVSS